ncbi:DNA-3-methyladenine glycosylase [Christensenella sp. MSJ-20]|uniref:DNA-3-methyladenine glycosylase n=1 Tax=Christensenella sp. MSJ-20 TaxID=2841518 RepID=UPI001C74439F|nr:DNA-3-methyladenine glycosylase [Christensenella sp. MSJ-20]
MRYTREELSQPGLDLARELIGATIISELGGERTGGVIVETEAYLGKEDRAAHSCRGNPNGRTRVVYGPGGYAYVHLIYGMYHCVNVVSAAEGVPQCVLLRSIYPTVGLSVMERRRKRKGIRGLTDGPGKLCMALGISLEDYGADFTGDRIYLLKGEKKLPMKATPRVGVDYAGEDALLPYRFVATDVSSLGIQEYERDFRSMLNRK